MPRISIIVLLAALAVPAAAQADVTATAITDLRAVLTPGVDVTDARALRWGGGTFVQARQTWNELPVYGGRLVADYDSQKTLRTVRGAALSTLPDSSTPVVTAAEAINYARGLVDGMLGTGETWAPITTLGVFARDGQGTLVQVVDLSTAEPVGAWRVFVDASSGEVLTWEQRLWTASADVYGSNPIASELTEVVLPGVTDSLANEYARVSSCTEFDGQQWECSAIEQQATPDADGDFFFTPDPTNLDDPFCEVQMFWHLDLVSRWFEDQFGFRATGNLGPVAMEGIVNFELQNAFYGDIDGDGVAEVSFGQGGGIDYAYDADVVYHEFGHAVFGSVVDSSGGRWDEYGRLVAPSALNEGSADLFSVAITMDPVLGEYAGGAGTGNGIRDLEPDLHCPTDIYGESHADGLIWGSMGWNVMDDPELGGLVGAHLVFGALNIWGEDTTFKGAGEALMESADDLLSESFIDAEQRDLIQSHIEASGLDDCGRVIRLDEGQQPRQSFFGGIGQGGPRGFPTANQYSIDAPEGTSRIRFFVDRLEVSDPALGWSAYLRRGEHVVLEQEEGDGGGHWRPWVPTEYDVQIDGSGEERIIELTDESDTLLEPGATYYLAVMARPGKGMQGFGFGEISITAEANIDPVDPNADDDDDDGGNGCSNCNSRVDGTGTGAWAFALFGLLLGVRRRR
jgi:MYXO-CTERM domain-containing protein